MRDSWQPNPRYAAVTIERHIVASQKQHWPTWVVVVAVIILIPPVVWALSSVMSLLGALSIGGILLIAGVIALFVWGLKNVEIS
jgi:hypothetical protein